MAFLCITYWMTASSPYAGIHLIDLSMKEELVKPWVAIASYFKRCMLFGMARHWLGWSLPLSCLPRYLRLRIASRGGCQYPRDSKRAMVPKCWPVAYNKGYEGDYDHPHAADNARKHRLVELLRTSSFFRQRRSILGDGRCSCQRLSPEWSFWYILSLHSA